MQIPTGITFSNVVTPFEPVGKQAVGQENTDSKGSLLSSVEQTPNPAAAQNRKPSGISPQTLVGSGKPSQTADNQTVVSQSDQVKKSIDENSFLAQQAQRAEAKEVAQREAERLERIKALQQQALVTKFSSAEKQPANTKSLQALLSVVKNSDPEKTLESAQRLKTEATSPPPPIPSANDLRIANEATKLQAKARLEIAKNEQTEKDEELAKEKAEALRKAIFGDESQSDSSEKILDEEQTVESSSTASSNTVETESASTESSDEDAEQAEDTENQNSDAAAASDDPNASIIALGAINADNPSGSIRFAVEKEQESPSVSDIGNAIEDSFSGVDAVNAFIKSAFDAKDTVASPLTLPTEPQFRHFARLGTSSLTATQVEEYLTTSASAQTKKVFDEADTAAITDIVKTTSDVETASEVALNKFLDAVDNANTTTKTASTNFKFINAINDVAKASETGKITAFSLNVVT